MIDSGLVKQQLISNLLEDGYGSFARRFTAMKFRVTDAVDVAAIDPATQTVMINPSMLSTKFISEDQMWDQLSVLIRHELLHYLMQHELRFRDHLIKIDPEYKKSYRSATIHDLANRAMDYEISNKGYDDYDKEVVRNMSLNGRIIGGLLAEDDHPEWGKIPMEEMYDKLKAELDKKIEDMKNQPKQKITIKQDTSKSQEYVDMYNKIIAAYNDSQKYPDNVLEKIISQLNDPKNTDPFKI